jgi:hypothetical protein
MKRINLTENDIFNIVNKVIAEQSKLTKTPEQLIKRFLYGDNSIRPNIPGIKNRTFTIVEKRGLTKESFQFIVQDVQFITTSKGSSALIKGYVKGQTSNPSQQTILEYICNSYGDFVLKEYEGLDENDVKKQKTPKPQQDDSESSFKNNVKQGIGNFKTGVQDVKQGIEKGFDDSKGNIKKGFEKNKESFKKNLQGVKQRFQNDKGEI